MSSNSTEAQFPSVLVVIVNYRNFWVTKPLQNVFFHLIDLVSRFIGEVAIAELSLTKKRKKPLIGEFLNPGINYELLP